LRLKVGYERAAAGTGDAAWGGRDHVRAEDERHETRNSVRSNAVEPGVHGVAGRAEGYRVRRLGGGRGGEGRRGGGGGGDGGGGGGRGGKGYQGGGWGAGGLPGGGRGGGGGAGGGRALWRRVS